MQRTRERIIVAVRTHFLIAGLFLAGFCAGIAASAQAGTVERHELEPGVYATVHDGRIIFLECKLPAGDAAKPLLARYLAKPAEWTQYKDRIAVAIPFSRVSAPARRDMLLAMFPKDYVTSDGWWHVVTFEDPAGRESWYALSEWIAGNGSAYRQIMATEQNRPLGKDLNLGEQVLIPKKLLPGVMREPTPDRAAPVSAPPLTPADPPKKRQTPALRAEPAGVVVAVARQADSDSMLEFKSDRQGPYAEYRLQRGEAIYTNVVVRYTDYREVDDIRGACDLVLKRSGIRDPTDIDVGQRIKIPLELLSDQYQPHDSTGRREYEAVLVEAKRLQHTGAHASNLKGVTVIIDPGHGGRDHGAAPTTGTVFEDEINYDIMCRMKRKLEKETAAKVYVTMHDKSQDYIPTNATRFTHDTDEEVMTTPRYANQDARISANLRWYLANRIYKQELAAGVDERNIIFISIHCDAIYYKVRGTMVYVPGAAYRRDREQPDNAVYASFAEARAQPCVTTTTDMRLRDEALSRNFAELLVNTLQTNDPPIAVHKSGDPIRNVIRRSGGVHYVPAVLRNTMVPTKVLVEVANLNNPTDQARVQDPEWREWYAAALVKTLERHYK